MEILQISPSADLSDHLTSQLQEALDISGSEMADVENILHVATTLPEGSEFSNPFFSPKYDYYLLSEIPLEHIKIFKDIEPDDNTIPIITLVADCALLYGRHTVEMFQRFLEDDGYLNKEQGAVFRMLLQESLLNAIEYGNLSLTGQKDELIQNDNWFNAYRDVIDNKLDQEEYKHKPIIIRCYLNEDQLMTSITDAGEGFNFREKLEKVDQTTEEQINPHGLGLGLLKKFAHSYHYDDDGRTFTFGIKSNFLREKVLRGSEEFSLSSLRAHGRILIVDDQASNRQFAKFYLVNAGYQHIEEASSGEEALQQALDFKPDIILLDIIMPDMNGFTVCRKLKQNKETMDIPILFLSGLTDVKNRVKGYRLGAVDYVNKPIDRNELIARTDIHIQNAIMFKSLQSFSLRIEKDLEKARVSQVNLLPKAEELLSISQKHTLHIEHVFDACDELAGDYWSIFDLDDTTVGIAMADFTGHGVAAALNTVFLHALFHELKSSMKNPVSLSQKMNDKLFKLLSMGDFATFIFGLLNTKTGEFEYVASGTPPLAISRKSGKQSTELLDCSGIPLGLIETKEINFEKKKCLLNKGDTIFIYSDALIETKHTDTGEMWLDAGLMDALNKTRGKQKSARASDVLTLFKQTAQMPLIDDLTLVSLTFGV